MLNKVWLTDKKSEYGATLLLGGFDGLHLGHRQLLACAKKYPYSIGVMTIFGGKGDCIFTQEERRLVFKEAGADFVFELPFEEIKSLSPEAFISLLQKEFSPRAVVCGEDFRFGAQAKGTPTDLKESGFSNVEVLPLLEKDGKKISSAVIKGYLENGVIPRANTLLGERFFLFGEVKKDRQVGRTLGFPTANIAYPKEKFSLKLGVYETRVSVDGAEYKGITNYGARPTFDNTHVWTETYLDGFSGDLYGRKLKVEFVRFLRKIERFESVEELQKQLNTDIRRVRNYD
nr:riboflavin biosynthesis protein RibF [Clostridia bacterium]